MIRPIPFTLPAPQAQSPAPAFAVIKPRPPQDIELCNGCEEEVRSVGEDGISVCENCGVVEGDTHWVEGE